MDCNYENELCLSTENLESNARKDELFLHFEQLLRNWILKTTKNITNYDYYNDNYFS